MNKELDEGLRLLKQAESKADIYKAPPLNELLNHPVFDAELSEEQDQ